MAEILIESWEDQSYSENWGAVYDNATIGTSFASDGSYGFEVADGLNAHLVSSVDDGLPTTPVKGDTIRFDFMSSIGAATAVDTKILFRFARDDAGNEYRVDVDVEGNSLGVWQLGSTNDRFAVGWSIGYQANTHYEVEIVWDDGTLGGADGDFTITLTDVDAGTQVEQLTGNNTAYSGGGVSIYKNSDAGEWIASDALRVDRGANDLVITTPDDGSVEYTYTASGPVEKVFDAGDLSAEESNDTITDNGDGTHSVSGLTGNGYGDSYRVFGEITAFSPKTGSFSLFWNGTETTVYDLTGTTPSGTGGEVLGGGLGYANTVPESAATTVVSTLKGLQDALGTATSGDVIYVDGTAEIEMGMNAVVVPDGVTLASDRGIDDAPGGLLSTTEEPNDLITLAGTSRFTGLRVRGPHPGDDTTGDSSADGVKATDDNEIDNCQIWGFSHGGVIIDEGGDAHVHHNVITECNRDGLGYGVSCQGGHPIIEYNYFYYNRHSIASTGAHHGYTARYNHVGPKSVLHDFDVHSAGCVNVQAHNNIIETLYREWDGGINHNIQFNGVADEGVWVTDNWLFNPNPPSYSKDPHTWNAAIVQGDVDDWTNFTFSDNYYGADANVSSSDIIPGYDGWRSGTFNVVGSETVKTTRGTLTVDAGLDSPGAIHLGVVVDAEPLTVSDAPTKARAGMATAAAAVPAGSVAGGTPPVFNYEVITADPGTLTTTTASPGGTPGSITALAHLATETLAAYGPGFNAQRRVSVDRGTAVVGSRDPGWSGFATAIVVDGTTTLTGDTVGATPGSVTAPCDGWTMPAGTVGPIVDRHPVTVGADSGVGELSGGTPDGQPGDPRPKTVRRAVVLPHREVTTDGQITVGTSPRTMIATAPTVAGRPGLIAVDPTADGLVITGAQPPTFHPCTVSVQSGRGVIAPSPPTMACGPITVPLGVAQAAIAIATPTIDVEEAFGRICHLLGVAEWDAVLDGER